MQICMRKGKRMKLTRNNLLCKGEGIGLDRWANVCALGSSEACH
jgi:hypothetical protein